MFVSKYIDIINKPKYFHIIKYEIYIYTIVIIIFVVTEDGLKPSKSRDHLRFDDVMALLPHYR